MTNFWIPNPGTGVIPVREGEILTAYMLRSGSVNRRPNEATSYDWSDCNNNYSIAHFQVSPPRKAEPATMSADEVLIRAREAAIEVWKCDIEWAEKTRRAEDDAASAIQAVLAYERNRAKPLAEVAPHTVEDPDERIAYDIYIAGGGVMLWETRHHNPVYKSILAGVKRGRELERGAPALPDKEI